LADAVVRLVGDAAGHALAAWARGVAGWDKAPGEPVSAVDLAVNQRLREGLGRLLPEAGWLSEESVDDPARLGRRYCWIVDPIDGTRDLIRRRPGWCVSVALVEEGRAVLGVLDAPVSGQRWVAERGGGAWRNGIRLRAGGRTAILGARVPVDALPKADRDLTAVAKPNSIALRMAMVAADEADLLASIRWGHEWDIAAAALIAQEAGAVATDALGGTLSFNTPTASAFGVLVTAPGIHAAAVERLAPRAKVVMG
jgi:myo-inositol-1(or 4)-monophosphatase